MPTRGSAPAHVDPASGASVWFLDPPVVVTRPKTAAIDRPLARYLVDALQTQTAERYGRSDGWWMLHDWSNATTYTREAREELMEWALRNTNRRVRIGIVRPRSGPLLEHAVAMAQATLTLARYPLVITPSLEDGLRLAALEPP